MNQTAPPTPPHGETNNGADTELVLGLTEHNAVMAHNSRQRRWRSAGRMAPRLVNGWGRGLSSIALPDEK